MHTIDMKERRGLSGGALAEGPPSQSAISKQKWNTQGRCKELKEKKLLPDGE